MIRMKRSEFRENVVTLLYINSIGGDFSPSEYEAEIVERFHQVIANVVEIDKVISSNLISYTIDRLNLVDLSIVRNCVYELMFTELPFEIAMNEAINLTKKFSNLDDDAAKRFNNKLLDNIKKSLQK